MNIVVTGGTKGIGRAIVELYASKGFNIITCARNPDDLKKLEESIRKNFPEIKIIALACDMSKKKDVQQFSSSVADSFQQLDVLINNAGIFMPGTIEEEADGTFERVMDLNIGGTYHITRGLLPLLRKAPHSHIFNVCSTASITAYTNGGSYCISKFAMLGFSKVLREELKQTNCKVTALLPGATLTDSWSGTEIPEERFMTACEVAQVIWNCYELKNAVIEEIVLRPQLGDL